MTLPCNNFGPSTARDASRPTCFNRKQGISCKMEHRSLFKVSKYFLYITRNLDPVCDRMTAVLEYSARLRGLRVKRWAPSQHVGPNIGRVHTSQKVAFCFHGSNDLRFLSLSTSKFSKKSAHLSSPGRCLGSSSPCQGRA
jgi:hypothetical protein